MNAPLHSPTRPHSVSRLIGSPGRAATEDHPAARQARRSALGFGILLAILACGLTAQPVHAAEEAAFEIVARDGRLLPEVLEVPAGVKLKLTLRNEGKTAIEFENLELRVEKIVAPDSASRVVLQPLKPGTYVFVDEFHAETGKMKLVAK